MLPFFSMVDLRKSLHRDIVHTLSAEFPGFLSTAIPNSADIERMGQNRKPVLAYSSGAPALAYQDLWEEIKNSLGLGTKNDPTFSKNEQSDNGFKAKEIRKTLERLQNLI